MSREAWLVLYIDRKTRVVDSAGIFSEPSPTAMNRFCTVPLFSEEAPEYHVARNMVILRLDSPEYRWVLPLLDKSVRAEVMKVTMERIANRKSAWAPGHE